MRERLSPVERLMQAMDECARARGEANWTNGYRCASDAAEQNRLRPKESAQWEAYGKAERRFRRTAQRVLREARHA